MPCERRSEIPSEGDARRCSYEVHVAPCAGVGAAVVDRRSAAAVVVAQDHGLAQNPLSGGAGRGRAMTRRVCSPASLPQITLLFLRKKNVQPRRSMLAAVLIIEQAQELVPSL